MSTKVDLYDEFAVLISSIDTRVLADEKLRMVIEIRDNVSQIIGRFLFQILEQPGGVNSWTNTNKAALNAVKDMIDEVEAAPDLATLDALDEYAPMEDIQMLSDTPEEVP